MFMKFNNLAKLFSELEGTTKRLEMIDLLSNFFRDIKERKDFEDLDKVIYLILSEFIWWSYFPLALIPDRFFEDFFSY